MCYVMIFVRLIIRTCFNIIIKTLKYYLNSVKSHSLNSNLKYIFSGDTLENKFRWFEYRCVRMLANYRKGFIISVSFLVLFCVISLMSDFYISTKIMFFCFAWSSYICCSWKVIALY